MASNMTLEGSVSMWSDTFKRWAKPLSDTEEAMADNAASIIRGALKAYAPLASVDFEVYATGSYRNNTNVRGESDIDVAAVCHDMFFYDLPIGQLPRTFGLGTPSVYSFSDFRADVQAALAARFGRGMTPGDKAFNVHENTYRLEADVTPFCEYRLYDGKAKTDGSWAYVEGVKSIGSSGDSFVNWHRDHYAQGVERNTETGRRFKRITRILKNAKFDMLESGTPSAKRAADAIPSFLIECLVFNAPDECFNLGTGYVRDVRAVITDLWTATKLDGRWNDMVEVNWRKWLFRGGQAWTREQAHAFLNEAWGHLFHE